MGVNRGSVKHPELSHFWFAAMVSLVVLVAVSIRFWDFFALPLTNDETSALMRLDANSVSELMGKVVWNDGHPMLVQVFLWYWTKWFGTAVWVVKLPFLLCGVGSVMMMVHIGLRLGSQWGGLLAAAMLATLQFPVMYSEIARPYAPGLLLALWAFYVWLRWIDVCKLDDVGANVWFKPLVLLAFAGYLGASNHYFNGLILALLLLMGFITLPRSRWFRYLWPWLLMAALYMHQINIFWHHLHVGSPGWLQKPNISVLIKHFMYSFGYSLWPILLWLVAVLAGEFMERRRKWHTIDNVDGEEGSTLKHSTLNKENRTKIWMVWTLYLAPITIAYVYSVFRAPVFQDSVLLFSFGFGLFGFGIWVDRNLLSFRWKAGLVLLTLIVNLYVLLEDRNHRELFENQSYSAAVKTLKIWNVSGDVSRGDAIWIYGFEPFFMEYHAKELGWEVDKIGFRGGALRFLREETSDYALFRKKLDSVQGDNFYYLNMVGMDPMLRVWIQQKFPVLRREAMGAGYHAMHFSRLKRAGAAIPLLTNKCSLSGAMDSSQYREVLVTALDSLGSHRFDAEFIAGAVLVLDTSLLKLFESRGKGDLLEGGDGRMVSSGLRSSLEGGFGDIRLVATVINGGGETIRFLDRGLGDMGYSLADVVLLDDGLCEVNLVLAGRLVDVEWTGNWHLPLNHFVGKGYRMQFFIDNAGKYPLALTSLRCEFWRGNPAVYGLVNPMIP